MSKASLEGSVHFSLEPLTTGVFACISKAGGAAYSNAGIIDLGDRTLIVDAFDTMAAGHDLRQVAEALFDRQVSAILLTHPHSDHWMGASAFNNSTTLIATQKTREISIEWGANLAKEFENPHEWEEWVQEMEAQLETETDEQTRTGLENSIIRTRYVMAEMTEFLPRFADETFDEVVKFHGLERDVEFRSFGRGHSEDDSVLFLPKDRIAFIGDIGFFDTQPFFGYCDLESYRKQMQYFSDSEYEVLVPGHGPVGSGKDDIALQLSYLDIMEELVGNVVHQGGSFEEARQIKLPEPFNKWLAGGKGRFDANVRYLFGYLGGEGPGEN